MADPSTRWDDNVLERQVPDQPVFYVDAECILCGVCAAVAPDNFDESPSGTHNRVYKQPATPEELSRCMEALENCPVEAIGDDGVR